MCGNIKPIFFLFIFCLILGTLFKFMSFQLHPIQKLHQNGTDEYTNFRLLLRQGLPSCNPKHSQNLKET